MTHFKTLLDYPTDIRERRLGAAAEDAIRRIPPQVLISPAEPAIDRFGAEILSIRQIEASDGSALGSALTGGVAFRCRALHVLDLGRESL
jgi:hypothetical protein